ncbi:Type IV secretory pathway, VirD2 components (relaxase) [plant metagenome]|uniref:Type IV secretory pathway, VirD2 components (Relaxase) n=1 Tax=plant metagenome TaxID=1297885 RepID=A0A484XHH6_9ZZZZ
MAAELKSHLLIERQARVIGATWLDQQLIGGGQGPGDLGFGSNGKPCSRPTSSKNRG